MTGSRVGVCNLIALSPIPPLHSIVQVMTLRADINETSMTLVSIGIKLDRDSSHVDIMVTSCINSSNNLVLIFLLSAQTRCACRSLYTSQPKDTAN